MGATRFIFDSSNAFFLIASSGHKGMYGHEFIEFEINPDGKLRYANNSNYKKDTMIRKELYISQSVLSEIKKMVLESEILQQNDAEWPLPDRSGLQELEIKISNHPNHISFTTCKLTSISQVQGSQDPEGLKKYYFLTQDLKTLVFDLISLHFKVSSFQRLIY